MKKNKLFYSIILSCCYINYFSCIANNPSNMILAGKPSEGRLGDNILLYCKAKYFSYKYGIPLAYRNFPYFDRLALSLHESIYTNQLYNSYPVKVLVNDRHAMQMLEDKSILFEIDYDCQMRKAIDKSGQYVGCGEYPFDWIKKKMIKYPEFGAELKRNLQVQDNLTSQMAPRRNNCITVAVTTRMGCGHDNPTLYSEQFFSSATTKIDHMKVPNVSTSDKGNPFKFVPQQFYVDQAKRLSAILQHRKMHIYFFIDKDKPFAENILAKWREALVDYKNITIECTLEKSWTERTLDDLYAMSHCDCLVRGCSHFSGIAQLAGEHKIIIGPDPISFVWAGNRLIFQKTFIYFQNIKENTFQQYVYEDTPKDTLSSLAAYAFN